MTKKHFSRAESQQLWRRLARWLMATAVGLVSSIVVVAGAPPASADEILTCQFGTGQVFDVQWDITGSTLLVSGMDYPFSNFNMFAPTPPPTRFDSTTLNETDYFQFFASTTVPGTLGLAVYSVDGTLRGVINETGSFEALGDGFLFYNGSSSWGTLLTTQEGFVYGDAATFAVTNDAPTEADVLAYQGCSAFPITAPVILDGTPPSGTVSQTYPGFTVPVAGTASVTFAVSSGTLPDGLILDPTTGAISGVPTVAGTYTFTITVTGPTGTATASYTISVAPLLLWETGGLARTGVGLALPVTAVLATLLTGAGVILTTWRRRGNAG